MKILELNILKKSLPLAVGFFAFTLILLTSHLHWQAETVATKRHLLPPPPYVEKFSFGYQGLMADAFWLRAIQDFDYCEQEIAERVCRNQSWLYKMLDTATQLDPKYRMVYSMGAVALSVIITDVMGASLLFDRGTQNFPEDWQILYKAAYHALFEEKNELKAAQLLTQAAKYGAPPWAYSLAVKLYTEGGKREVALKLYQDLAAQMDEQILVRMRQRLGL